MPKIKGILTFFSAANANFSNLIFINQLYLRLEGQPPPHQELDLTPKEVESLHEVIAAKLAERRKGKTVAED